MRQNGSQILEQRLRELGDRLRRAHGSSDAEMLEVMSAPAFRAVVAQRLRALERDVAEVRTRVNGLLFVVAGAVLTQLVLRLVG
jgi:hypothetical protein